MTTHTLPNESIPRTNELVPLTTIWSTCGWHTFHLFAFNVNASFVYCGGYIYSLYWGVLSNKSIHNLVESVMLPIWKTVFDVYSTLADGGYCNDATKDVTKAKWDFFFFLDYSWTKWQTTPDVQNIKVFFKLSYNLLNCRIGCKILS